MRMAGLAVGDGFEPSLPIERAVLSPGKSRSFTSNKPSFLPERAVLSLREDGFCSKGKVCSPKLAEMRAGTAVVSFVAVSAGLL